MVRLRLPTRLTLRSLVRPPLPRHCRQHQNRIARIAVTSCHLHKSCHSRRGKLTIVRHRRPANASRRPDSGPRVVPEREPGPWTAGLADCWEETVKYTPSALLFGQSGEEVNQRAKQAVEDWLAKNLLDDQPDQSEGARLAKVAVAGVLKSASDVGLDMIVTPVLDPGTVVRGVMRTGVASAQGMHDIEEGKTLEGSMKIVGEVSGVVLMVLAPVRAGGAKAVRPIRPGEPSITMYSERIGFPTSRAAAIESKTAHNIVEVRRPQAPMRRTDVVPKAVGGARAGAVDRPSQRESRRRQLSFLHKADDPGGG